VTIAIAIVTDAPSHPQNLVDYGINPLRELVG